MEIKRKEIKLLIGRRLGEERVNLNEDKAEFVAAHKVTEEHYRKLEVGTCGVSTDKFFFYSIHMGWIPFIC